MPQNNTVTNRIVAQDAGYTATTRRAERATQALNRRLRALDHQAQRTNRSFNRLFSTGLTVTALYGVARGFDALIRAAGRYEFALAGVSKTTDIVGRDLERLGDRFARVAVRMGESRVEIAGIAQIAGQLGIEGVGNIGAFTQSVLKLANASDLTAEQAATMIARFRTLAGLDISEIDRVNSSIVALGNNFAALESEILHTTLTITQGLAQYQLADTFLTGLGTATAASGLRAESSRTAFRKFTEGLVSGVREGGQAIRVLSQLLDEPFEKIRRLADTNVESLFLRVIQELGNVDRASLTRFLELFGVTDERTQPPIITLVTQERNTQLLSRAISTASGETGQAVALNTEQQRRRDTTLKDFDAIVERMSQSFETIAIETKDILLPTMEAMADSLEFLADRMQFVGRIINGIFSAGGLTLLLGGGALLRGLNLTFFRGFGRAVGGRSRSGSGAGVGLFQRRRQIDAEYQDEVARVRNRVANDRLAIERRIAAGTIPEARGRARIAAAQDRASSDLLKAVNNRRAAEETANANAAASFATTQASVAAASIGGFLGGAALDNLAENARVDIERRRNQDLFDGYAGFLNEDRFLKFAQDLTQVMALTGRALSTYIESIEDLTTEAETQKARTAELNRQLAEVSPEDLVAGDTQVDDLVEQITPATARARDAELRRAQLVEAGRFIRVDQVRDSVARGLARGEEQRRLEFELERDIAFRARHVQLIQEGASETRIAVAEREHAIEVLRDELDTVGKITVADRRRRSEIEYQIGLEQERLRLKQQELGVEERRRQIVLDQAVEGRLDAISRNAQGPSPSVQAEADLRDLRERQDLLSRSLAIGREYQETYRPVVENLQRIVNLERQRADAARAVSQAVQEANEIQAASYAALGNSIAENVAGPLRRFFQEGGSFGEALGRILTNIKNQLIETAIIQPLIDKLSASIQNLFQVQSQGGLTGGGAGNFFLNTLLNAFTGNLFGSFGAPFSGTSPLDEIAGFKNATGRASGGPVSAGRLYRINEHGPEYFVPNSDGVVYPTGEGAPMLGGVNLSFNISGVQDPEVVENTVRGMLGEITAVVENDVVSQLGKRNSQLSRAARYA